MSGEGQIVDADGGEQNVLEPTAATQSAVVKASVTEGRSDGSVESRPPTTEVGSALAQVKEAGSPVSGAGGTSAPSVTDALNTHDRACGRDQDSLPVPVGVQSNE